MHTTVAVVHDKYFSLFFLFFRKPRTPIALYLVHYKSASVLLRGNKEQQKKKRDYNLSFYLRSLLYSLHSKWTLELLFVVRPCQRAWSLIRGSSDALQCSSTELSRAASDSPRGGSASSLWCQNNLTQGWYHSSHVQFTVQLLRYLSLDVCNQVICSQTQTTCAPFGQ